MAVKEKGAAKKSAEKKSTARKSANGVGTTKFTFDMKPDAREVYLVGDFNDWNRTAHKMAKRKGAFHKSLKLPPGDYEYRFLADGEWHTDPSADDRAPNPYGGHNSVVKVRRKS